MLAIKRILVPVDFSSASKIALQRAMELAARFEASIDVLHVWDLPGFALPEMQVASPGKRQTFEELAVESAERAMAGFLDGVEVPSQIRLAKKFVRGDPWRAIVERTERDAYDLVIVGTHGRTGFDRVLLGSVAEKVVRASHCPVLTVRDEKKGQKP